MDRMRYLLKAENDQMFAYAPGRRDFFTTADDRLWAHESHGWLIAAESGETLAHRTGDVYYGAVDGKRLYRLTSEPATESTDTDVAVDASVQARRPAARVARSPR
jgi:hypothetical protein